LPRPVTRTASPPAVATSCFHGTRLSPALAHRDAANRPWPPSGERRAANLYHLHRRAIYARCRQLLDSPDEAEDATQEVFIRLLHHLDGVPAGLAARRWLSRAATNYCFNVIRDRNLRRQRLRTFAEDLCGDKGHLTETIAVRRDQARRVLAALSPGERPIAVLHFVDDMTQDEVASALGISRRTVVNRLADLMHKKRPRLSALRSPA
jgi:RNA polymerase sigma-70 factor, ECF subfamily